jgi:uncharacterized protein YbjQ (UPF0145 family)
MKSLSTVLLATGLALALPAQARNVVIVQPVEQVLTGKKAQDLLGDLQLRFGGATAGGGTVVTPVVQVDGVGEATYDGSRRPTDEQVCERALFNALSKLVLAARKSGANAVVGLVSNYGNSAFDDPKNVECHAGTFKAHVVLRGQLVRLDAAQPGAAPAQPR